MTSVTATEKNVKQPGESRLYNFDFSALLELGVTLDNGVAATISVESFNRVTEVDALTVGTPAVATPMVQVRILAGTDGENYRLNVTCTDTNANILELDGILLVRDK